MPALRSLYLSFLRHKTGSRSAWEILANAPRLPALEDLELSGCGMDMHNYTRFVLKHLDTLKLLDTQWLGLYEGTDRDVGKFYAELSKAPRLETFYQYGMTLGDFDDCNWVGHPLHLCFPHLAHCDEDEDGYLEIDLECQWIRWKGQDEVRDVLAELAVCLS